MSSSKQKQLVNILDKFTNEYLNDRKLHLENWLNIKNGIGRIFNRDKTFNKLRILDFKLTQKHQRKLKKIITHENLSKNDLVNIKTYLINHRLILNFRTMFIALVIAIGSVTYAFFEKSHSSASINYKEITLFCFFVIFGFSAFYERWNIKQKDSIYQEIENLIQNEIDLKI